METTAQSPASLEVSRRRLLGFSAPGPDQAGANLSSCIALCSVLCLATLGLGTDAAWAEDGSDASEESSRAQKSRREDPPSSRLFFMPSADVVGPYRMSLSYDGSVLREPGILSSAGVFALGIGDLAQLEYRHTSAIGIEDQNVPVPAVGVQLRLPIPELSIFKGLSIAYRLGVPHIETRGDVDVNERVTDVYAVSKLAFGLRNFAHLALRYSQVDLAVGDQEATDTQWLPAMGLERRFGEHSSAILEVGYAPRFELSASGAPTISNGITGRLGLRWRILRTFSLDVSAGYLGVVKSRPDEVLDWDIRVGGEYFIEWDEVACRNLDLFCD